VQEGSLSLTREPLDPRYQRALSGRYWLLGFLQDDGIIVPISASRSLLEATLVLPPQAVAELQSQPGTEIRSRTEGPDKDEPLRLVARQVVLPNMNTPVRPKAAF